MRRHVARLVAVLPLALLAATGCLHAANNRPERDPNVIMQDEIDRSNATDAYNIVSRLRGEFLNNRGKTSINDAASSPYPIVYVDGTRFGELSVLRTIPAAQVGMIRLYRAWEAQTKFGNGNTGGVIEVTTRR